MKTYGNLDFASDGSCWRISNLSPHVAMMFKRLFPRAQESATVHIFSDTDAIRADLQWFMGRYPLKHAHAETLEQGAARARALIAERDSVLLPTWTPGPIAGFRDGEQPYLYQAQAARIAITNRSLLIGDDVGLGKTVSAITAFTNGAPLPAAVVVQAHLADQWRKQIERFTHLRVHVIKGRTPYDLPAADIYVFRYSNVVGWVDAIDTGMFRTVAYDEVQELRHGDDTAKGQACAVATAKAELRLGLTATPIYNYGDEIHNVMGFIEPDLLGNRSEFVREWCGGTKKVKDPDGLGSYLRDTGYFLRRTENDPTVNASMPPANIVEWQVDADEEAAADEEALTRQLALTVIRGSFVEAGKAARELDTRMRQLTGVAKARSVASYVRLLLRDTPRVLLAGWHRDVYEIWSDALAEFNPVLYTGSESSAGKGASVEAFTAGDARVMMISLRSGVGLDGLQFNCRDVVFGELDWSPQVHYQIIGRLRRPGQPDQVTAHYLHTDWGSDPVVIEMLGIKTDQSRGISDPGLAPAARFSDDSRIKRLAAYVLGEPVPA